MAGDERSLRFGFIDFGGDAGPRSGAEYRILDASDPEVGKLPIGRGVDIGAELYSATLQILTMWVEDLPDLGWRTNEGLLKLSGRTRRADEPEEKLSLATTLDFDVRDERRSAVDFEMGFSNVFFKNRLTVGLELVELDRGARHYYDQIKEAVAPVAGPQLLDVLKPVPYLELATKVADGLINAFGKEAPDQVWSSNPVFAIEPLPGAPYLRSGIYVAFEDPRGDLAPHELSYKDQAVVEQGSGKRLERNLLLFSIGVERAQEQVISLMQ